MNWKFWKSKTKCQKFFKYDSKELNISGLKASLPKGTETVEVGLGEVSIKPELTQVSEKIQNPGRISRIDACCYAGESATRRFGCHHHPGRQ